MATISTASIAAISARGVARGTAPRASLGARRGARSALGRMASTARGRGRRGGAGLAVSAAEDDAAEEAPPPVSQTRKRSPKPLPSTFGEGKVTGKKTLPFQDPFETNKSATGAKGAGEATSPFDMPASALDAPAKPKAEPSPAASSASPFGAPAPAAGAKPASPFGAAAPASPPASPFGAAPPASASKPPAAGASPFADTGAFGSAPGAGASPFAKSGAAANPFGDAKPAAKAEEVDERSAWEKIPKPAMAQVVIVLSFTTIISLMLATFWVVVQVRSRTTRRNPSPLSDAARRRREVRLDLFCIRARRRRAVSTSRLTASSRPPIPRPLAPVRAQLGGVSFNDN